MNKSIGIAAKLVFAISLFALPVGYTINQLYASQQVAIDFSNMEVQGNRYLGVLRHAHGGLLSGADKAGIADAIVKAEVDFGDGMASAELAQAAEAALKSGSISDAAAAIRALIVRVGNKSNLILDPDLDSYYVMDLVLLKVPDLLDRVTRIANYARARQQAAEGAYTITDVAQFLNLAGGFNTLVAGTADSVDSAYNGSKDNLYGRVSILPDRLGRSYETMRAALQAFSDSFATSRLAGGTDKLDIAAITAAEKDARASILAFGNANDSALGELLEARIDTLVSQRIMTFAVTFMLFVLAIIWHQIFHPKDDTAGQ